MQTVNLMQKARTAIRSGRYAEARRTMRQAIRENPDNYAAWLLLARATPSTQAALEYVKRAAMLQPDSPLVHRARTGLEQKAKKEALGKRGFPKTKIAVIGSAFLLLVLGLWFGLTAGQNVANAGSESLFLERIIPTLPSSSITEKPLTAPFQKPVAPVKMIEKPVANSEEITEVALVEGPESSEDEQISSTEDLPAVDSKEVADPVSEVEAVNEPAESPDSPIEPVEETLVAEGTFVEDTEEAVFEETTVEVESFPVVASQGIRPPGVTEYENWIDVNLTSQTLVAYEGDVPVFNTLISSGLIDTPTVTGQFKTYMKYEAQDMNGYLLGYDYYLEGVPYVMYFYNNFAIHGTYWHNSFGTPMSHGCVNMSPWDAGWLFSWAPVGTTVNIHY